MRRPRPVRALLLTIACALGATSSVGAEEHPPSPSLGPTFRIDDSYTVGMVLVPLVARARGDLAGGLRSGDLHLRVGGQTVPIETFERKSLSPISLVILQDLSGSMAQLQRLEASRRALGCVLGHASPEDRFALASFGGGRVFVEVPFTDQLDSLEEAMGLWEPYGTTALFDAVSWLPEIADAAPSGRPAALLITDGIDNASEVPHEKAREIVARAGLPVYVLALRGPRPLPVSGHGTLEESDPLRLIATATGGRYHDLTDLDQVSAACAAVLAELRNHYLLGFSIAASGEPRYLPIEVELRGRQGGISLTHRRGYHGRPPAALERN